MTSRAADLAITIPHRLRYWVAQGMIDEAIQLEAGVFGRSRKTKGGQFTLSLARELRELSAKVLP